MFHLWLLMDHMGGAQTYASLDDCVIARADLLVQQGIGSTARLLHVTDYQSSTLH